MEKLIIKKISQTYSIWSIQGLALDHLALFLTGEVRDGKELEYFNDLNIRNICYNESCIYKDDVEEDLFIISSENYEDGIPDFKIKNDKLQRLIDAWIKVYTQNPDKIDLMQEDDKFTFEFDTKDGHQVVVVE